MRMYTLYYTCACVRIHVHYIIHAHVYVHSHNAAIRQTARIQFSKKPLSHRENSGSK